MRFFLALTLLALVACERTPPVAGTDAARADAARRVDVGATAANDAGPTNDDASAAVNDAATAANDDATAGPNDDAAVTPGNDDAAAGPNADATVAMNPDASTPAGDAGAPMMGSCAAPSSGSTGAQLFAAIVGCLHLAAESDMTKRAAIDRFVLAAEAGEGFPIHDGNDLVFVYVRSARWDAEDDNEAAEDFALARRNAPITLSGDFNMWATNGPTLTDEGFDFFDVRIPAPAAGTTRSGYKLIARDAMAGLVYFSDPLSRRFDFDSFGRISFLRGGDDHGHLERLRSVHAAQLNNDRPIYVWLPPGYETNAVARFPVLYMHDGNNLFSTDLPNVAPAGAWNIQPTLEAEIFAMRIRAPIVVGIPNNADRFEEYTQVLDDPFGNGGTLVGGDALAYGDFIVTDLKPQIDARFRTEPARESTGVIGSSLGGLVSYVIGLAHPGVFKYVGGMSSTFAWGRFAAMNPTIIEGYQAVMNLPARDQVYYLDTGGGMGGGCMGIFGGADNYCATAAMRDALIAEGVTTFPDDPNALTLTPAGINIYHWTEGGAQHTESAWAARFFRPLRLFFRR